MLNNTQRIWDWDEKQRQMDSKAAHLNYFISVTVFPSYFHVQTVSWSFWEDSAPRRIPVHPGPHHRPGPPPKPPSQRSGVWSTFVSVWGPLQYMTEDKCGLLWDKKALAGGMLLRMTGSRKTHNPISRVLQKALISTTPLTPSSLTPTGFATNAGASQKTALFAKQIVYSGFFTVVSKVCSSCSFLLFLSWHGVNNYY